MEEQKSIPGPPPEVAVEPLSPPTRRRSRAKPKASRMLKFFSNPWVGIVGALASVISVPLAVYFFVASRSTPDIVYYTNPARAIIVQQGSASRLKAEFDGQPITTDVTAVQVAIWNRGNQAVRQSSILDPVVIRTEPAIPILEASVRKSSRDVVQLKVDQAKFAEGKAGISWNVLEYGDGGVIQLVYAGSTDTKIRMTGIMEGQPAIQELEYPKSIMSASEQVESLHRSGLFIILDVVFLVLPLLCLAYMAWFTMGGVAAKIFVAAIGIAAVVMYTLSIIQWWNLPDSPFGF